MTAKSAAPSALVLTPIKFRPARSTRGCHRGWHDDRLQSCEDDAEVDHARQCAQGDGQEVVDEDEETANQPHVWMERPRADRDDAAPLGEANRDFRVLDREQDEYHQGHGNEKRGSGADLPKENSGGVVDRRSDVREDHRPAEEGTKPLSSPAAGGP